MYRGIQKSLRQRPLARIPRPRSSKAFPKALEASVIQQGFCFCDPPLKSTARLTLARIPIEHYLCGLHQAVASSRSSMWTLTLRFLRGQLWRARG